MKNTSIAVKAPSNVGDSKFWTRILNFLYIGVKEVIQFVNTVQIRYYSSNIQITQPDAKFLQNCKQEYRREGMCQYSLTHSLHAAESLRS
jgi:hypothetical protein